MFEVTTEMRGVATARGSVIIKFSLIKAGLDCGIDDVRLGLFAQLSKRISSLRVRNLRRGSGRII